MSGHLSIPGDGRVAAWPDLSEGPFTLKEEVAMDRNAALPTRRLQPGAVIAQARDGQNNPVTLDSPALEVMTDLTQNKAATTGPSTTLRQAEQIMINQGVRMLFVVSDMPAIEGLVTSTDLHGDTQMRLVTHWHRLRRTVRR
jgi:CBS domain-containing protein